MDEVALLPALYVANAGLLYVAYAFGAFARARPALLYAAHIAAMVAADRLIDTSVLVSVVWGVVAIGSLVIAVRKRDRVLAQSSFPVFAVSGLKVMALDLEGSAPLVKIGCLAVLGVSLYAGGWLYKRLGEPTGVREVT